MYVAFTGKYDMDLKEVRALFSSLKSYKISLRHRHRWLIKCTNFSDNGKITDLE